MGLDTGMIRRALKGDVHGDVQAQLLGFANQGSEVFQGAQLWQQILVAPFQGANGPGAADIARLRGQGVVAAFALFAANGVDGRKVQHVEAHFGHIGQALFDVLEGAMLARF